MRDPHTDPKAGDKVTGSVGTIIKKEVTRTVVMVYDLSGQTKVTYTAGGPEKTCSLKAWTDWCRKNCQELDWAALKEKGGPVEELTPEDIEDRDRALVELEESSKAPKELQEAVRPPEKAPDPQEKDSRPKTPPPHPKPLKRREGPYKGASKPKERKKARSPQQRKAEKKKRRKKEARKSRRINRQKARR